MLSKDLKNLYVQEVFKGLKKKKKSKTICFYISQFNHVTDTAQENIFKLVHTLQIEKPSHV